jgi:glycosyltransferase involved in cell wall biosynthesis
MDAATRKRVVLVHDWLTGMRGGEKCLEVLCRTWPDAPIFTLLHKAGTVRAAIERRPITTTFLQRLPSVEKYYRNLLPLMPAAAATWRLPPCDLVLSLSHCVAKAVKPPRGVPHVCYCFTPMRYAWHQRSAYFAEDRLGPFKGRALELLLARLRSWDQATAQRVSHFIAISKTVERRIHECYGRSSTVIYPPVDTDFFCPAAVRREDYYLMVSAFAPYKRLDLAIAACNRLRRRLILIGKGQDERRLRSLAGPTVSFLGWQTDQVVRDHFRRCKALLFPGEEDFGIVPVEAQACGAPVIASGSGGATETVIPLEARRRLSGPSHLEPTGLWFDEATAECLAETMIRFESRCKDLSPGAARRQAVRFHTGRFEEELFGYLDTILGAEEPGIRQAA